MEKKKYKILVLPSDRTGVSKFRSIDPHIYLQKMYPDEFWVDIQYNPPYYDDNFWKQYDLVHYHRSVGPDYEASKAVAKRLTQWGIPHIMDLDDYWLPTPDHPAHMMVKDAKIDVKIRENIQLAQYMTTTTSVFAEEISKLNKNVTLFPNAIDHEEKQYIPKPTHSDRVRVGWLGGSSHIEDLNILNGVAGRLHGTSKDKFQVVLCGYDLRGTMTVFDPVTKKQSQRPILPKESVWYKYEQIMTDNYRILGESSDYKNELLSFKKKSITGDEDSPYRRVWTKPITTYAANYNFFDVSLAPLKEHIFNKVKSQLKVIEAGFHKKAFIGQDFGPYTVDCINAIESGGSINPKGNSLLIPKSKNHKLWFKYIKKLVDNPSLVEDLGEKLHETVYPQYTLKTVTEKRAQFYRHIITK
jgi:glycosyltransferase involved in cell wall biosynthesis